MVWIIVILDYRDWIVMDFIRNYSRILIAFARVPAGSIGLYGLYGFMAFDGFTGRESHQISKLKLPDVTAHETDHIPRHDSTTEEYSML